MFDFGQIIEKVTGLVGDAGSMQDAIGGNLTEILGNANIDPSLLENLSLDQAQEFLSNAGIDASALGDGQLAELLERFTGPGNG